MRKSTGKKKESLTGPSIGDMVRICLDTGNLEKLDEVIRLSSTDPRFKEVLQALNDYSLKNFSKHVDMFASLSPGMALIGTAHFNLVLELLLSAMLKDFPTWLGIFKEFPLLDFSSSQREATDLLRGGGTSFSQEPAKAKQVFLTYFENNKKMASTLGRYTLLLSGKSAIDAAPGTALKSLIKYNDGRYAELSLDETERFIRNAIAHTGIRKQKDGTFHLSDNKGRTEVYDSKFLDKRAFLLWLKLRMTDVALSIATIVSKESILVAMGLEIVLQEIDANNSN